MQVVLWEAQRVKLHRLAREDNIRRLNQNTEVGVEDVGAERTQTREISSVQAVLSANNS